MPKDKAKKAGLSVIAMKTQAGKYLDKEREKTVNSTAAVKWVLKNKKIDTILLSIRTYEDLEDYMSIMENPDITKTEREDLQASISKKQILFYEGCEKYTEQCKHRLPIPDLMRAYMYVYGYKDLKMEYDQLKSTEINSDSCNNCADCTVDCFKGFNISERIKDINRLQHVPKDFIT